MDDLTHVNPALKCRRNQIASGQAGKKCHRAAERGAYLSDANGQCNKNNKLTVTID
ncbi:MAG: hypothetical protein ACREUM_04590 [Nitrosospira sp.]